MRFLRDQPRREFVQGALGRKLKGYEHIHHIDHNHANDDLDNLAILTRSDHALIHRAGYTLGRRNPTIAVEIMRIVALDITR